MASEMRRHDPFAGTVSTATLWVLAVGVSRYQDQTLNLRFADADAEAIASALEQQRGGPAVANARALILLNEKATRDSIIHGFEDFLGQAGLDDIVVVFLAGHGVQDTASGSYYFLPSPATADTIRTAGLPLSDIDDLLRVIRGNVRGVVVMLDTCHAGALRVSATDTIASDELITRLPAGDGFFLFAATSPGEESMERDDLGHGAFTAALLEGLGGLADPDADGILSLSDLFSFVAQRVPVLAAGAQHPYHKSEGADLLLAAVVANPTLPASPPAVGVGVTPPRVQGVAQTIGVTEFHNLRADPEHDWIGNAIRVAFNTELSKVRSLRVYVPQVIDRTSGARRADQLAAARQLGIRRLVTGSFHVVGTRLRIDAEIVDTAAGVQEASDSVEGDLGAFFDLQKQLVFSILRRLRVRPSAEEDRRLQKDGSTDVDAYRLLLETEGLMEQATPPQAGTPTHGPDSTPDGHSRAATAVPVLASHAVVVEEHRDFTKHSPLITHHCLYMMIAQLREVLSPAVPAALAAEAPPAVAMEVRQALEAFRVGLERKDLDGLASLYVTFTPQHREVLRAYLSNADELRIEFTDVTLDLRGDGVVVAYTRVDHFVDRQTHKPVRLEARLARLFVRQEGTWKVGAAQ
jgi:TolB-like protein